MKLKNLNDVLKVYFLLLGKLRLTGILFFFLTQICFSQSSADKQKYDLNDPRNPDCPCHKYQKMADDEYEKLKKKNKESHQEEISENENFKNSDVRKIQFKETKHPLCQINRGNNKKQKRKRSARMHKHINFFTKALRTRKIKPDFSVCFRW